METGRRGHKSTVQPSVFSSAETVQAYTKIIDLKYRNIFLAECNVQVNTCSRRRGERLPALGRDADEWRD